MTASAAAPARPDDDPSDGNPSDGGRSDAGQSDGGPDDGVIRSAANPRYRSLRALIDDARARRRSGQSVLEGEHLVRAWLERGGPVVEWVVAESSARPLMAAFPAFARFLASRATGLAPPRILADRLLAQASSLPSPPPVLAIIETPQAALPATLDGDLVILDRLQDPANVGAVLRTIAAAGLSRVITTPGTAACWSPKALRAGMGGQFALTLHEGVDFEQILARLTVPLVATVAHGGKALAEADLRPALAWWLGNEGEGIAVADGARASLQLRIDQSTAVESLNVAAAAAVCLFEQRRQRRPTGASPAGQA